MDENILDVEILYELQEEGKAFEAWGYSMIKVARKNKVKQLKVPIRSTGVAEFQTQLAGKAPSPPTSLQLIKKDSKEGRNLGLVHDRLMHVFDFTDANYIKENERWEIDFNWRVVAFALDDSKIKFRKADGSVAEKVSLDEKIRFLKSNGITGHHTAKIFKDVQLLTKWEEDETDFLPGS